MTAVRTRTSGWAALLGLAAAAAAAAPATVELAYVANAGNNHVQVVDLESGRTVRKIYAGTAPWRLSVSPDRRHLWVQHWYSATTAVVDLDSHEIERILPFRGPGVFAAGGERFLTFSWPLAVLHQLDARTSAELSQHSTDVRSVYDLAVSRNQEALYLVQHDPMLRGARKVYSYVLSYPWAGGEAEKPMPISVRTGSDPLAVRVLERHPFLFTVDHGTNGLSLINELRAGQAVPTCAAPRVLLLSPDDTRMIVACWQKQGAPRSEVVAYEADFTVRPWPTLRRERTVAFAGALLAGAFSPAGDRAYLADRAGKRLLEVDAATLAVRRTFAVGDEPMDVAVVAVPAAVRDRLAGGKSGARRIAERAIGRLMQHGAPFTDVSWREVVTPAEADPGATPEAAGPVRRLELSLSAAGGLRSESEDGRVRLAQGGTAVTIDGSGRFWVTPRQELISVLYTLPNLSLEEALRHLAGDVPGSPFLRAGVAIDVAAEVEDQGRRVEIVGAFAGGARVSQLWVDVESGRPINLVEQIPSFRSGAHEADRFTGLVETRFGAEGALPGRELAGGRVLPAGLLRVIDGHRALEVRLEDVRCDRGLPAEHFSLRRLGGVTASAELFRPAATRPAADGPGGALPVLASTTLHSPWQPHPPYNSNPPTSGARFDQIADWGVHRIPVPLALQVGNLERGGVLVQYNCPRGCAELEARLTAVAVRHESLILAPYPLMEARIALTALGRIETLEAFDEGRITAFIEAYAGQDRSRPGFAGKSRRGDDDPP